MQKRGIMKLKTQIIAGFSSLFILIIILFTTSIYFVKKLDYTSDRILKENYISIIAGQKMLTTMNSFMYSLSQLDTKDVETLKIFNEKIDNDIIEFNTQLHICKNNITESGEKESIEDIKVEFKEFNDVLEHIKRTGFNVKSLELAEQQGNDVFDRCSKLIKINQDASLAKNKASREAFKSTWNVIILLGAFILLIAIIIIIKIPSLILKPIGIITKKIKDIAEGDYNQKLDIKTHNELAELAKSFNEMSGKLVQYNESNISKELMQKRRIETIVNQLSDGIIVFDDKLEIVIVNLQANSLLGMKESELIGKLATEVAINNNLLRELLKEIPIFNIQNDEVKSQTDRFLRISNNSKEEFYLKEVTEIVNHNESEEESIIGYIVTLKNVTTFKEMDEAKTNLIAVLSHEFRTPLAALNMSVMLMQNEKLGQISEGHNKILGTMKNEIQRLMRMVDELLDVSRVQTGHIKLNFQETDINFIINYSITPFMAQIKEKEIKLVIEAEKELPALKIDAEKITWVIMNLFVNAIRYTPKLGELKMIVSKSGNFVLFCVEDSGPGIDAKYLDKIFEKFFQVPVKNSDEAGGLGLGLAICKEIIEAHHGQIWVESQLGSGSKFSFELPIN